MKYVAILALGIAIGSFGAIKVAKVTGHYVATGLSMAGGAVGAVSK
jgi:hypothetical protein